MPALEVREVDNLIVVQNGVPLMDSRSLFLPTEIARFPFTKGKIRQNYDLGDIILMVCGDGISAFDVVMNEGITGKGIILTQMSIHLMDLVSSIVPNHFITANIDDYPAPFRGLDELRGRSMLVEKLRMYPIECVERGYLAGSAWAEYRKTGTAIGHNLPPNLMESSKLEQPIFTPATKAETGHDENITLEQMIEILSLHRSPAQAEALAILLKDYSAAIYRTAVEYALARNVIIADTKFEFGEGKNGIVLADEVLTPDSSRFWPAEDYVSGRGQRSFDKQYVRDYVDSLGWDHEPPPPPLPEEVVRRTAEKYREAYIRLVHPN